MDLGLKNKTVLVTGASRGIGKAIAEVFAAEGARLFLVSLTKDRLEAFAADLRARHGSEIATFAVDLGAPGSALSVAKTFPSVDILVNNAGAIPKGEILDLDDEGWRAAWDLKVFGYINMTREYFRDMKKRRSGVIVNIIGLAAEKLDHKYLAGSTGNAALAAFTRALGSATLDFNVRVLGIHPGFVETDRTVVTLRRRAEAELGDPDRWRELLKHLPGGRMIAPSEIADLVAFLASGRGNAVSGQVFTADAGFGSLSYPNNR